MDGLNVLVSGLVGVLNKHLVLICDIYLENNFLTFQAPNIVTSFRT